MKLFRIALPVVALGLAAVAGCSAGHGSPGATAAPVATSCGTLPDGVAGCSPATHKAEPAPPAAVQTPAPAPAPIEPVSTKVCMKVQKAWAPFSQTGGNANGTTAQELALGQRVWNLAQRIPGNEVYFGTSQTPGLKVALDVWSQDALLLGHGGSPSSTTIQEEAQTISDDCATLGIPNVWGLSS